jgi:hypothetical protein
MRENSPISDKMAVMGEGRSVVATIRLLMFALRGAYQARGFNAVKVRTFLLLSAGSYLLGAGIAEACTMNEIQKPATRIGLCRQQPGIASGFGCTSLLMEGQVADQFQQIALARRCGFNAEADTLQKFYDQTTPYVVSLYECVDTSVDRPDVEAKAKKEVEKNLSALPAGCSADLKDKISKRLPKLIAIDEKSLAQVKALADEIQLKPKH